MHSLVPEPTAQREFYGGAIGPRPHCSINRKRKGARRAVELGREMICGTFKPTGWLPPR